MINELILASQSVQALATLLGAAKKLSNYNDIVAAVADVNIKLMQANAVAIGSQEKLSASAARIHELEQECARLKDWTEEQQRYELKEVAPGFFVQIEKNFDSPFQSAHKLCANCFVNGAKSLLQQEEVRVGCRIQLTCHRCKATVVFDCYSDNSAH